MKCSISILKYLLCIAILIGCREKLPKKPNIIFILTDDQRWDALRYAGNSIIYTPNMDMLAQSGIYFKNAFVTTPICAASRASLLTGLYERTHDHTFWKPAVQDEYMQNSYPVLLQQSGYRTGFIGKFGVDVNEGIMDSMFDYHETTSFPYLKEIDGKKQHLADINGNHAINFIRSSRDRAFCLSLSFWSPHADDNAKEQYFWPEYMDSLYQDVEIPVPQTADPDFFENLPGFLKTGMNRERWYWRFDTPAKHQKMVKGYYRMVSTVDSVLGRILKVLDEEGVADNTVIIFMGDNGYFLGERGYAGKWLLHETSIRVPLIIFDPRMPEAKRGRTLEEMALNIDITPTILDIAGIDIPDSYHGKSLNAFIDAAPLKWRSSIFLEHRLEKLPDRLLKTEGIRDDTWKFIRYDDHPEFVELYNHRNDPNETTNLAKDSAYAETVQHYSHLTDSTVRTLLKDRIQ